MSAIDTEFLFRIVIDVARIVELGETPYGRRRIAEISGGTIEGPRLKGRVAPGGGDWVLVRRDGVTQLDVRLTLETDDGALIYMTYRGARHGPPEVIARVDAGEAVDPSSYYFRTAPFFETSSADYAWLNGIVAVATGERTAGGPVYHVHQVL